MLSGPPAVSIDTGRSRSRKSRCAPGCPTCRRPSTWVPGLYLNSYPLTCSGDFRVFEMTGTASTRSRRDIQDEAGVAVWIQGSNAYSYRKPSGLNVVERTRSLTPLTRLGLFVIREAIVEHCQSLGFDSSIVRAGELHVGGAISHAIEDRFRIEHVLRLRVATEEYIDADAVLTARHRTAWRCVDNLSNTDLAARAKGSPALRLRGDGPHRGRVEHIHGETATLRVGVEAIEVPAADYTLAVNAAFVAAWRGPSVLRKLRVTTGDLTVNGKRNQHGVEDRFKLVGDAVRRLGGTVPIAEEGSIDISRAPVQVRLEATP